MKTRATTATSSKRRVTFRHGDGSASLGRIDCYKRGHFVLEAKKIKLATATRGFDDALQRARGQAEGYARALPADEGRPPFLIVVDVGRVIEMEKGGFSYVLRADLPRFNGKLFKQPKVIALDRDQIGLLIEAAHADWTLV